jgi:hypothetical protein
MPEAKRLRRAPSTSSRWVSRAGSIFFATSESLLLSLEECEISLSHLLTLVREELHHATESLDGLSRGLAKKGLKMASDLLMSDRQHWTDPLRIINPCVRER